MNDRDWFPLVAWVVCASIGVVVGALIGLLLRDVWQ